MKRLIFLFIFSLFRVIVHFHHGKAAYLVADPASFEVKKNWFKSSIFNCMTLKKYLASVICSFLTYKTGMIISPIQLSIVA